MLSIGFPISHKENEKRIALLPKDLKNIANKEMLFFETGYGKNNGFDDHDYTEAGCKIVSRDEALSKDVICDPKVGDAEYLRDLKNQTVFGWIHAVQNKDITDAIIGSGLTAIAWEDMFEQGRHIFWRNNELAGEAAIMNAFQHYGIMPYTSKVALIGRGNVGNGALRILTMLGADVTIYTRKTEKLLQRELEKYDVIVNAILWDTSRKDHIIYEKDLFRMKKNSMIVDVSCDRSGAIESSIPTTIEDPVYYKNGVLHYVVDHTPSLFFKTASSEISAQVSRFIDEISNDHYSEIIEKAVCIKNGIVIDERINEFQGR